MATLTICSYTVKIYKVSKGNKILPANTNKRVLYWKSEIKPHELSGQYLHPNKRYKNLQ